MERGAQTDLASNKNVIHHIPKFSNLHPMIPKRYVMEWKTDMKNRTRILQNAKIAGIYPAPHDESIFLEKRERLNHGEKRDYVAGKCPPPPRAKLIRPPFHHHFSKFTSELMYRRDPWEED